MRVLASLRFTALLCLLVVITSVHLATHAPFAFYSPDVSFHMAKIRRAAEGRPFQDPIAGTPSIYPSTFHMLFALPQRAFQLTGLETARVVACVHWCALFATAWFLAWAVLGRIELASVFALALPLVFYEPTGRHVLSEIPANLSTPLVLAGLAFLLRALERGRGGDWMLGAALLGVAVDVVWYQGTALLAAVLLVLVESRRRRWPLRSLLLAGAALVGALALTAWHFLSIRGVIPDYTGYAAAQVGATGGLVAEWLLTVVTRGNFRHAALLDRSVAVRLLWYLLWLPAGIACLAASVALRWVRRGGARPLNRAFDLAALVFLSSLPLALTRDVPRVAVVQFTGYILLLLFVVGALAERAAPSGRVFRAGLAAGGILTTVSTVRHTAAPFEHEPPGPTAAVVRWLESQPGHRDLRVFVSETNLRRLVPFVTFLSFVNHSSGRYYSEDPLSSARLLDAHAQIFGHGERWREAMLANDVRYLLFRHAGAPDERASALYYLGRGQPVLQNGEWWVIDVDPRRAPP